ncbi:MAG: hypothetical protein KGZ25_07925 [Planctomycetes bacterium]|nr:hypothetical protein [Planctomycetota bacterium]
MNSAHVKLPLGRTLFTGAWIVLCFAFLMPTAIPAAPEEAEPDVFYEDFTGKPAEVFEKRNLRCNERDQKHKAKRPQTLELIKHGGHRVLHLKGGFQTRVFYQDKKFKNFVLETTVQKTKGSYGGVVVRDHWRIYFQMKGFLCLNSDMPGLVGGRLFKSDKNFRGYHKLKVVCAGPLLHAYVDGQHMFTREIPDKPGKVGFYAHHGEVFYRDFRIDTHVEPSFFLAVKPKAPEDSLIFPPGEDVKLKFDVINSSPQPQKVMVSAIVKSWANENLSERVQKTLKAPRGSTTIELDTGQLPVGFHKIVFRATLNGQTFTEVNDLPLAVQEKGSANFQAPKIPVAAYSKYYNKTTPIYYNTYAHAIARKLRTHGFNAIVADPFFTKKGVEIYRSYGIATIARSGSMLDHPAVIGTLLGDEPKPGQIDELKKKYDEMAQASGKPVTTCMVGEGMGLGSSHDPVRIWRRLDARVRAFRWYGIKKSYYSILHDLKYKGVLPLASVMRIVEASEDTAWWFVPPSFGATHHEGYFHNPTPAEMRGLMHMAMAHGCDGLLLWCLQSHGRWPALLDQKSLQPPDGKLEAASEVAELINGNVDMLATLRYGGFQIRNSNPIYVEAEPRKTHAGDSYIYVVNKDARNPAAATIAFKERGDTVRDVFSGKKLKMSKNAGGFRELDLELSPSEAMLLDVDVPVPEPKPVKAPAGRATADPELVATVQERIDKSGVAVLSVEMAEKPCVPGDAIGLSRADDLRNVWEKSEETPRCFSWSGLLHERTREGYLGLAPALRLADAAGKGQYWTLYPALGGTEASPGELRAMLHLALAYGSRAVLVPDTAVAQLQTVVSEVSEKVGPHGEFVASLHHAGLDIRCKNARIVPIPRQAGKKGPLCVYAVNMDTEKRAEGRLLLWDGVWDWTEAREVYAGEDLEVKPRDAEGYLSVAITLRPGEGRLIRTDARVNRK